MKLETLKVSWQTFFLLSSDFMALQYQLQINTLIFMLKNCTQKNISLQNGVL